jgi:cytochrome c
MFEPETHVHSGYAFQVFSIPHWEVFMRNIVGFLVCVGLSSSISLAYADQDLLQKKNCYACHGIDKRKYGPKLVEVAAKYADVKDAEKKIAKKIRAGGTGVWGADVMPPQPQVSQAEALVLSKYILSLK